MREQARKIKEVVVAIEPQLVALRRDLHKYAETGWTEFRTTAILSKKLVSLGYEVDLGENVISKDAMMGVPKPDILKKHMERAIAQGADPELVAQMSGGMTGLVATLRHGEGPTLALRFDIDANDINESQEKRTALAGRDLLQSILERCTLAVTMAMPPRDWAWLLFLWISKITFAGR